MLAGLASQVSANGGLSLDTFEQHSVVSAYESTNNITVDTSELAHAPVDQFETMIKVVADSEEDSANASI